MKVRIKFTKRDAMSYIGHLDVMRYFQKVIRRAEIPIAFSSGYSPHMIMSFASPLGLGVTSEGEYFDIELTKPISSEEAITRMNATGVGGIEVLSFRQIPPEKKHSGMTILAGASYRVTFPQDRIFLRNSIDSFMAQPEICVFKETKRSAATVDIKPLIYDLKVRPDFTIEMTLAAGSRENLKPNLVMKALCAFLEKDYQEFAYQFHRLEMYANDGTSEEIRLVSLESLGEDIA